MNSHEEKQKQAQVVLPDRLLKEYDKARSKLLPEKSGKRYLKEYELFCNWRKLNKVVGIDERVMLAFFEDQYKNSKPSCLWSYYAMIRSCLLLHEKVDIKRYGELHQYLKRKTTGCIRKKSKVLSHDEIIKFLKEADDDNYLLLKVILILGIFGGCRRDELINITMDDVEDHNNFIKVYIRKTKTGVSRSFVITEDEEGCHPCVTIKKYISLRPPNLTNKRLLIGYRNKKCVAQVVGVHTVGNAPKQIAQYLGLADANQYTGHCFRRSSASLLAEGGGDLGTLMTHGGWKSVNVARGYVEQSTRMKTNIANKIIRSSQDFVTTSNVMTPHTTCETVKTSVEINNDTFLASTSCSLSSSVKRNSLHKVCDENKTEDFSLTAGNHFHNISNCSFHFYK